jgi:hypothetical protein
MSDRPQTWHYGLVARYWAEQNTDGPEIPYFQNLIERHGQPALDAGCGTRQTDPLLKGWPGRTAVIHRLICSPSCRARAEAND